MNAAADCQAVVTTIRAKNSLPAGAGRVNPIRSGAVSSWIPASPCWKSLQLGAADHVHILAKTPKTIADSEFVAKLKANSAAWVKSTFNTARLFAWQGGYGWFSVSRSNVGRVSAYLEQQEEHHRSVTFKEEILAFLVRHEIECDERYIWE